MKDGSKTCPSCRSLFTFEAYELVDSMLADAPCEGCVRLYAILAESARQKAEQLPIEPAAEEVDLSDVAAIEARLRAGRPQPEPVIDWAKAASGDEQ